MRSVDLILTFCILCFTFSGYALGASAKSHETVGLDINLLQPKRKSVSSEKSFIYFSELTLL